MSKEESFRQLAYFGFTADEFCEDASEMIEDVIKDAMKDLEKLLISKSKDVPPETIMKQIQELQALYLEKAKAPSKKLQEAAKEIFTLPADVKVPGYDEDEDDIPDEEATLKQLEALKKEDAELKDRYMQKRKFKTRLKAEKAKLEMVQPLYESNSANLKALEKEKKQGKTCEQLFGALETCHKYLVEGGANSSEDLVTRPVVDKYNMFKKKKK